MSLAHDYHEERQARLVRLGARPCVHCEQLRSVLEKQRADIEKQGALLIVYEKAWLKDQLENARKASSDPPATVGTRDTPPAIALSIDAIIRAVAEFYEVTTIDVRGQRRTARYVKPRQVAMHLCVVLTGRSLPTIARMMGDRDHTTVLYGHTKIRDLRRLDANLDAEITEIEHRLGMAA